MSYFDFICANTTELHIIADVLQLDNMKSQNKQGSHQEYLYCGHEMS